MPDFRSSREVLLSRILEGDGRASPAQRRSAFVNAEIGEPVRRAVLAAGASRQQIEDALAVCFAFNVISRLADAFGFFVPGPEAFDAGAKYLLEHGYK
jgi:hypothetical protein